MGKKAPLEHLDVTRDKALKRLRALSADEWELLYERYVNEQSLRDLAGEAHVSVMTIKRQIDRILIKLTELKGRH